MLHLFESDPISLADATATVSPFRQTRMGPGHRRVRVCKPSDQQAGSDPDCANFGFIRSEIMKATSDIFAVFKNIIDFKSREQDVGGRPGRLFGTPLECPRRSLVGISSRPVILYF